MLCKIQFQRNGMKIEKERETNAANEDIGATEPAARVRSIADSSGIALARVGMKCNLKMILELGAGRKCPEIVKAEREREGETVGRAI